MIQSASAWWNKVAAAFAVAVVPDHVAGAPPEAFRVAGSRKLYRAFSQEHRSEAWRSGVTGRLYSDEGFGFIKLDDGGADVFIHKNVIGGTRDCILKLDVRLYLLKFSTSASKDVCSNSCCY